MRETAASSNSSGRSSTAQDGPFPYVPPAREVRANLERRAVYSSLSMPGPTLDQFGNTVDEDPIVPHNQNPQFNFPTINHPKCPNVYRNPGASAFGLVHSDNDLPRDVSQFHHNNVEYITSGVQPTASYPYPTHNGEPAPIAREQRCESGRSKFKAFLDKMTGRRQTSRAAEGTTGATNVGETANMLEEGPVEPFPDFYAAGGSNTTSAYQTASSGSNARGAGPEASAATQRRGRDSSTSSNRRVARRSVFATMKSRVSSLFGKSDRPERRGRTWEPTPRRNSNPFSPFTRRNARMTSTTTHSHDMYGSQHAVVGRQMV
ncbi:hypothetical protein FQN54_004202 [Arachnomyces sp. PD_36]|nr:hypothetical protein FQN54_004202 [Arachnomyces sp. PD_36]